LRIAAGENTVRLDVIDEGVGIYSGDLERIFDPFTQIDSTSTREYGGTGIGLYVCQTLADALGGRIDVESVLGKGSTFSITLPRKSIELQSS
jgi:signal transduction histidine kinase